LSPHRETLPKGFFLHHQSAQRTGLLLCLEKDILMSQTQNAVIAQERALEAARLAAENLQFATLGRRVVEMRHSFNNAMTSLLGNAELLLQNPDSFSARVREQLQTIQAMALRLHHMMQRFNSLEAELQGDGVQDPHP